MSGQESENAENPEPEGTGAGAVSPFVLMGDSDAATCADGVCAIPDTDD